MAMAFLLRDVDRTAGLESMEGAGSDLGRSGKFPNAKAGQGARGGELLSVMGGVARHATMMATGLPQGQTLPLASET